MKKPPLTMILGILIAGFVFQGCQSEIQLFGEDLVHPSPQLDEVSNPPNTPDKANCPPSILFNPSWTYLPAGLYPGYDLVARIDPGLLPVPIPGCYCREYRYCLNMNILRSTIEEAAVLNLDDPDAVPVVLEAYAHAPEGGELPPMIGEMPLDANLPDFHQICVPPTNGLLVMLRYNPQFPPGIPLSQIIVNAVGICIVDNVPDTGG